MTRRLFTFGVAASVGLSLSAAVTGCTSPVSPPAGAPYSQTDLRVGTGDGLKDGHVAKINYTGWIYNPGRPDQKGAIFDTNLGSDPVEITVAGGDLIEGFERALPGMAVGGLRRVVVPPSLGYGETRNGLIPPNATLIFEIELVSFQ
jgi:FKBP-type peptidyl-prolyl cis-trans isomerase FkpA